jgi:hypothetical protein
MAGALCYLFSARDANRLEPCLLQGPIKFVATTTVSTVFPDRAILSQTTGPVQKNLARWKELAELAANEEEADRVLRWCAKLINFWNRSKGVCATYPTSPLETQRKVA